MLFVRERLTGEIVFREHLRRTKSVINPFAGNRIGETGGIAKQRPGRITIITRLWSRVASTSAPCVPGLWRQPRNARGVSLCGHFQLRSDRQITLAVLCAA